jgi:putative (di)nucleoside polyphosphate hydrolase
MSTKTNDALRYRPCVGIALFNNEGKVFVGERINAPGAWQMPQGGIGANEDIKCAALREMKEEIGTDRAEIICIADCTIRYDLPEEIAKNIWNGRFRGQEQTWVALRFTGQDTDIDLNTFEHPEFSAWQWVDLRKIPDLIISFKRDVYTQVVEIFSDILQKQ